MSGATRIAFWLLTGLVWLPCPQAVALNPALDVSQYAHTAWRIRDGFSNGHVSAIAQTTDGFLWLATDLGLVRFDGVRITRWQPGRGQALPGSQIRNLLGARDGALWIATERGLARLSHGELVTYPQFDGWAISGLTQDRRGTIWASGWRVLGPAQLCAFRGGRTDCYGGDGRFGERLIAISEDRDGNLWLATTNGVWRWLPGSPQLFSLPDHTPGGLHVLSGAPTGGILVLTSKGVEQIIDGKINEYWAPGKSAGWQPNAVLTDRSGAVWIGGTERGLFHFHDGRVDEFGLSDGLSGNFIVTFLEDREGNVWVVTTEGIDRFRALPATSYSTRQGVLGNYGSVLADRDGSLWISTTAGLYRWQTDHFVLYHAHYEELPGGPQRSIDSNPAQEVTVGGLPKYPLGSLFQDHAGRIWLGAQSVLGYLEQNRFVSIVGAPAGYVDSIAESPEGNLWISHRDAGLLELSSDRVVHQTPWTRISQSGPASRLAVDPSQGGLWLGFHSGGIVHLVGGEVRASYGSRDGLGKGRVNGLRIASDGTVWVATDGGLSRLRAGHITTLTTKDGLPCDKVDSSIEEEGSLWLYTACGLLRLASSDLQSWGGDADQARAPRSQVPLTILDNSDGVPSFYELGTFSPHIARTADGKLWFVTQSGLTVVDPHHPPVNELPPPVRVERIIANRTPYEAHSFVQLPPLLRDLEVDYTALSLVAPEKMLFRYKLEGRDRDWQEAGNRRQAFYGDLAPGNYRFRVIASNNSGVWNEQGDVLAFSVAPAYWQTVWFRALCAAAFLGLLWLLYLMRLRQVRHAFDTALETRVDERTRIARDLHDSLLQGFQGLMFRLQAVRQLLPERPGDAANVLDSAMQLGDRAIGEGRDAVQNLRSSSLHECDLATSLSALGTELETGIDAVSKPQYRVVVEGSPREMTTVVRDDAYRIAREAVRNAYHHAKAGQIETEITFGDADLIIRVRDDGIGVDPQILAGGQRAGHWGLPGMRERSESLGGQLRVWSEGNAGTEVELRIPAKIAYAQPPVSTSSWITQLFYAAGRSLSNAAQQRGAD